MVIQVSKEALERLLLGDPELEAQVRYQICENFASRRLKTFLNDEAWRRAWAAWTPLMQAEIQAAVDDSLRRLVQNDYVPGELRDRVYKLFDSLVTQTITKIAAERTAEFQRQLADVAARQVTLCRRQVEAVYADLDNKVNARLDAGFEQLVKEGVAARLRQAAELANGPDCRAVENP